MAAQLSGQLAPHGPAAFAACVAAYGATWHCLSAAYRALRRRRERRLRHTTDARVLSLQSHVVHGYVGNRCAVFPLQLLGLEVDAVNTVQFSNHTGYPTFKGQKVDGGGLHDLVQGMRLNGLHRGFTHFLTGYIGSVDFLKTVREVLTELRSANPALEYFCDPVMGDNGQLYLPPEMVPLFRELICEAHTITPNQFEAEQLSLLRIDSLDAALGACEHFHSLSVKRVVISSLELDSHPGELLVLGSEWLPSGERRRHMVRVPREDGYYTGTGDLLSALLLGWCAVDGSLAKAMEKAVAGVQAALLETKAYYTAVFGESPPPSRSAIRGDAAERSKHIAAMELRIVQSRNALLYPDRTFRAERLPPPPQGLPVSPRRSEYWGQQDTL